MKPLLVLLATFVISLIVRKFAHGFWDFTTAGNIAMAVMLVFTAIAHFKFKEGMARMLPDAVPYKMAVIYATGLLEIIASIGLLIPSTRFFASWLLIIFFFCVLPANISAALRHIDYEKSSEEGKGPSYLWLRVPLQAFFIGWVYWFGIHVTS